MTVNIVYSLLLEEIRSMRNFNPLLNSHNEIAIKLLCKVCDMVLRQFSSYEQSHD